MSSLYLTCVISLPFYWFQI